jgi:short-subunit dehydrogenase
MIGSKERYALVTGASSGIGYELAKLFAEDGKNLVVVSRTRSRLEELKREIEENYGSSVRVIASDLSNPNSPEEIFSELGRAEIRVDVLVNNAAFGVYGVFSETDLQKELEMIQVNVTALTHLTKLFMRGMVESKYGRILNVGSIGSFAPVPLEAVYGASKAFVLSFSEALANELKGTGVGVTCLCPGLTDTGFYERAVGKTLDQNKRQKMLAAAKVARAGYRALEKGRGSAVPGFLYKLLPIGVRVFPRSWILRMSRWVMEQA